MFCNLGSKFVFSAVFLFCGISICTSEDASTFPNSQVINSNEKQGSSTPSSANSMFFDLGGVINQLFPGFNQGGAVGNPGLNFPSNSQFHPSDGAPQPNAFLQSMMNKGAPNLISDFLQSPFPNHNVNRQGPLNNFQPSQPYFNQGDNERYPGNSNGNIVNGRGNQFGQNGNIDSPAQSGVGQDVGPVQFPSQDDKQWNNPKQGGINEVRLPNGQIMNNINGMPNQNIRGQDQEQNLYGQEPNRNNQNNQGGNVYNNGVNIPQTTSIPPNFNTNLSNQGNSNDNNNGRQTNIFWPENVSSVPPKEDNNREWGQNSNMGLPKEYFDTSRQPNVNQGVGEIFNSYQGNNNQGAPGDFSTTKDSEDSMSSDEDDDDMVKREINIAIKGKNVVVPPSSNDGSVIYRDSDTITNTQKFCIQNCQTSTNYNPVCGTDKVIYFNPEILLCARNCGIHVFEAERSRCNA